MDKFMIIKKIECLCKNAAPKAMPTRLKGTRHYWYLLQKKLHKIVFGNEQWRAVDFKTL